MTGRTAVGLLIFLLAGALYDNDPVFYWNASASLPKGLYMRVGGREIARGDVVIFRPPFKSAYLLDVHYYIKTVGGLAGDEYEAADGVFYLRKTPFGKVYETDGGGNPLRRIPGRPSRIKDGCFLPLASTDRSYDGRYYGDIPIECIKYKVKPVFTY